MFSDLSRVINDSFSFSTFFPRLFYSVCSHFLSFVLNASQMLGNP